MYQVPQKKKVNERMYSVCVSYYYDLEIYFKGAEKWLSDEQHLLCDSEDEFWSQHSCKPQLLAGQRQDSWGLLASNLAKKVQA